MESSPSGPLICTVDMGCVRAPFAVGFVTLNVTPGGIESGAEPILDWHGEVVAKVLLQGPRARVVDCEASIDAVAMRCARLRMGVNMAGRLLFQGACRRRLGLTFCESRTAEVGMGDYVSESEHVIPRLLSRNRKECRSLAWKPDSPLT